MAIIILQGADFSANNIGQVSLPFMGLSKAILTRYGITIDESDTQQIALDTFVRNLSASGLLGDNGKIKSLALPFLADSLSDACINALNGNNFFTTTVGTSLTLSDGGLKPTLQQDVVKVNILDYVEEDSYHLAGFNTTNETDEGVDKFVFGRNGNIYGLGKNINAQPAVYGPTTVSGNTKYSLVPTFIIGNVSTSAATLFCDGEKYYANNPTYDTEEFMNPVFGQYLPYTGYNPDATHKCSKASWGVLSVGDFLSDAESLLYNREMNKLLVAYGLRSN